MAEWHEQWRKGDDAEDTSGKSNMRFWLEINLSHLLLAPFPRITARGDPWWGWWGLKVTKHTHANRCAVGREMQLPVKNLSSSSHFFDQIIVLCAMKLTNKIGCYITYDRWISVPYPHQRGVPGDLEGRRHEWVFAANFLSPLFKNCCCCDYR